MLVLCYADCYTKAVVEAIKKRTTRHLCGLSLCYTGFSLGKVVLVPQTINATKQDIPNPAQNVVVLLF